MPPVFLLPPSEGKAPGGEGPAWVDADPGAFPELVRHRLRVARALAAAMRSRSVDNAELLGIAGPSLPLAVAANKALLNAPTMPALERYTGVVYDALDYATLPAAAREGADASVLVVSGLLGLVAPGDATPDYKLPMGAALPTTGRLATWWRPLLQRVLSVRVADADVWDLLPGVHASAIGHPTGAARWWSVRVLREASDGTRGVVSHDNKQVKGALVRHLLETGASEPAEVATWVGPGGYRVDLASSSLHVHGGTIDLVRRESP